MMKQKFSLVFLGLLLWTVNVHAQPAYYNSVNLDLEGMALKNELASHIISTHTNYLSYGQVWDVLKSADLNPENSNKVLLIYGYNDNDGNQITDRTRSKNDNGGSVGDWNREHVYAKSLGTPNLGTSGPGSDAHHLRSCDVQMNSNRGSLKFANGSGHAGPSNGGWYPGNEWKGDVARMMMYMYLRYGNQCFPNNVGLGSTNNTDSHMINMFLDWNAADPVSEYELTRNDVVQDAQGNRNPFIDDPALATVIWGGPVAADPWGIFVGIEKVSLETNDLVIFPNPCSEHLSIHNENNLPIEQVEIYNQLGEIVLTTSYASLIDVRNLSEGYYFLAYQTKTLKKITPFIIMR